MLDRYLPDRDTESPHEVDLGFGQVLAHLQRSPERPERNEDSLAVWRLGEHLAVLAVADGMGGAPAGDAASRLVVRSLDHALSQQVDGILAAGTARAALMDGIELASEEIRKLGVGAASTVVIAELGPTDDAPLAVRCMHVGDSQMLHCGQRGAVRFKSLPHSPVGYAVEAGLLDEQAAMSHADRHLVSNMVGVPDMQIQVGPRAPVRARDTVVLASDGLWDNLAMDRVVELVRIGSLSRATEQLIEAASRTMAGQDETPGKPDDLAVLVFRRSR